MSGSIVQPRRLDIGDRVGRYRLERLLGAGGQADVWAAVLEGPGTFRRKVALRILHQSDSARLKRERRLQGLVRQRNLVEVYEVGVADGLTFVVQELLEGGSLVDRLDGRALSPRATVELGRGVLGGLVHLHDKGVVHRDVTPANILLTAAGEPRLGDLGLCLFAEGDGENDRSGTPGFRAPEHERGERVSGRADVWSLGATLFYAAVGRPLDIPVGDRAAETLERQVRESLVGPLADVLVGMLAVREADRPTASEALRLLRDIEPRGRGLAASLGFEPVDEQQRFAIAGAVPQVGHFVGRAAELAALVALLGSGASLVTVHGPGGIGKTTLVATALRTVDRPGGVYWVELAEARDEEHVLRAIAEGLGIPLDGNDPVESVGRALALRPPLCVVLDNVEQVVGAVSSLLHGWQLTSGRTQWVLTSREELGLEREEVLSVGPLDLSESRELFLARGEGLVLGAADAEVLQRVLERLDGIPLAIELAAARAAEQGLGGLDAGLGRRGAGPSGLHPALVAAIEASWELLLPHEREALAQLSVFEGSFGVDAVDEVVLLESDTDWVFDILDTLLRKALLTERDERLRLFVPIREFASWKLDVVPDLKLAAEERHAEFFASMYRNSERQALTGAGELLRLELTNILVAARRSLERHNAVTAAKLVLTARWVLRLTGPYGQLIDLLEQCIALSGQRLDLQIELIGALGSIQRVFGLQDASRENLRIAIDLDTGREDSEFRARLLASAGNTAVESGQPDRARELYAEALEVADRLGSPVAAMRALFGLAALELRTGRAAQSDGMLEEVHRLAREVGDHTLAVQAGITHGIALRVQGRGGEAEARLLSLLDESEGELPPRIEAQVLQNLAVYVADRDEDEKALELFGQAESLHRQCGERLGTIVCASNRGELLMRLGRLQEARGPLEDAKRSADLFGEPIYSGFVRTVLARLALTEGRYDAAALLVSEVLELGVGAGLQVRVSALCIEGEVRTVKGRSEEGRASVEQATELAERHGLTNDPMVERAIQKARERLDAV